MLDSPIPRMSQPTGNAASQNGIKRSSIFIPTSHDKRNLWWKAFRKTVLEPHNITIESDPRTDEVPPDTLWIVEDKIQNLERYEAQALEFREAVWQGRGFGPSPIFPPDVVPPVNSRACTARCMEPTMSNEVFPTPELSLRISLFELPPPRPGLACGFTAAAFDDIESQELPSWLNAIGTISDYETGQILPGQSIYCPFLLFERTYGHTKHEIEFAMNYCAISGSASLNAIKMLYDKTWITNSSSRPASPVVFSCVVDDDIGIINHHWIDENEGFHMAPLCKFDFRDLDHFMHFLAWIEAIEVWAADSLLLDIRKALNVLAEQKAAGIGSPRAIPTPVTDAEKEEKLSRAMRTAFDNLPWKGERVRTTPLSVTAAMRMRSPRNEPIPEDGVEAGLTSEQKADRSQADAQMTNAGAAGYSSPMMSPDLRPVKTDGPVPQLASISEVHKNRSLRSTTPTTATNTFLIPSGTPTVSTSNSNVNILSAQNKIPTTHTSHSSVTTVASTGSTTTATPDTSVDSLQLCRSPVTAIRPPPPPPKTDSSYVKSPNLLSRPATATISENNKSPSMFWTTMSAKSPSQSVSSIQSKRSFLSLRREKRIRSPQTPEFGKSPKGVAFVSKISNGLDIIKEHARPKRVRMDNEGPQSSKSTGIPAPMPTPAYDKRYFEKRTFDPLPNTTAPKAVGSETETPRNLARDDDKASNVTAFEAVVPEATVDINKPLQLLPAANKKIIGKPPQPRVNTLIENDAKAGSKANVSSPVTKSDHTLPLRNWSKVKMEDDNDPHDTASLMHHAEQPVSISAQG